MTSAENLTPDPVRDHLLRDTSADAGPAPVRDAATTRQRKLPGRLARIYLEGVEEPLEVRVDNRDHLRWDKTAPRRKWGSGRDVPFLFSTFLAWSAATRAELTALTFEEFEAATLEVEEVTSDEDDDARPTR